MYLSLYGDKTKKSGYARLKPGGAVDRLVWLDKNVGSLAKAKDADVYGYIVQDYDDSPDIFVGGPDLKDAKQVDRDQSVPGQVRVGPQRTDRLQDATTGRRAAGRALLPGRLRAGQKYPMIVYMYELLSQNVHRYVAPSDRSYYNTSVFTSHGYFVFQPDIVFTPRQPGVSVVRVRDGRA